MCRDMMTHKIDLLVVKDFSRFSRRNSRGLVEPEDLRDAGVRIISIGDNIDYPTEILPGSRSRRTKRSRMSKAQANIFDISCHVLATSGALFSPLFNFLPPAKFA